jgi:hypothetical protein
MGLSEFKKALKAATEVYAFVRYTSEDGVYIKIPKSSASHFLVCDASVENTVTFDARLDEDRCLWIG